MYYWLIFGCINMLLNIVSSLVPGNKTIGIKGTTFVFIQKHHMHIPFMHFTRLILDKNPL